MLNFPESLNPGSIEFIHINVKEQFIEKHILSWFWEVMLNDADNDEYVLTTYLRILPTFLV